MSRRMRSVFAALAIAVSLSACSALNTSGQPVALPVTYQQSLAYGYAQLASAYNLLADLVERRRMPAEEAQRILAQLDELRAALDVAQSVNDPVRIQSATQGLIAIETALRARAEQQK